NLILQAVVVPRPLARYGFTKIPNEHSTLVVMSEFVTDESQMLDAIKRIRTIKAANNDPNISCCLLVDLRAADEPEIASDESIIKAAADLGAGSGINIFIRRRVLLEKRYGALERKRGAIDDLVRYLCDGKREAFRFILDEVTDTPKYFCVLDADNVTDIGGIRELVGVIAHPDNADFDLIALRPKFNLASIKTYYSKRFLNDSAYVSYPNFTSFYFNLFGIDIFSGKGIFRTESYKNKLIGVLPRNKVLSHDIIEGALLNTASAEVVYEDAPKTFISERERRARWERGDIQLLPFLNSRFENAAGERVKHNVRPFYKFIILKNALSYLAPLCVLTLGVFAAFSRWLLPAFLFFFLFNLIEGLLNTLITGVRKRHRLRYVAADCGAQFLDGICEMALMPYYAFSNLFIIIKTLKRMFLRENLLEWKTFSASQGTKSSKLLAEVAPPLLAFVIVDIFVLVFGGNYLSLALFAAAEVFAFIYLNLSGIPFKTAERTADADAELKKIARLTYGYFSFAFNHRTLISDNLQVKPYKGLSKTTSPTNLGFQILSEICGYELGFSEKWSAESRISAIIENISRLKKFHGNLYNWYDTLKQTPVSDFVSSVDSGNLLACLIVADGFVTDAVLKSEIAALIRATDLTVFYDTPRRLLFTGVNAESGKGEGHYDLLASEARLTALLFSSLYNQPTAFRSLMTDFTSLNGNTLLSWSGTAFEYLMPDIFIVPPKFSLLRTASERACKEQIKAKYSHLFGISESGYYAFDENLQYQYRAYGLDALALGKGKEDAVISPYASALMLRYSENAVLENFKRLERFGMSGGYGFFEALDLAGGSPKTVEMYMTHHQGMLLTALTNRLCNDAIIKYFGASDAVRAAKIMLTLPPSKAYYGLKPQEIRRLSPKNEEKYSAEITNPAAMSGGAGLIDGGITGYYDALGNGFLSWGGMLLNAYDGRRLSPGSFNFYKIDNGEISSLKRNSAQNSD
ncbi:MAG: hypothetical protein LBN25_04935, partial [Christensenellaceae bacterium]|nr:hypothetical protein [Christensenellaceae bacterium]